MSDIYYKYYVKSLKFFFYLCSKYKKFFYGEKSYEIV